MDKCGVDFIYSGIKEEVEQLQKINKMINMEKNSRTQIHLRRGKASTDLGLLGV